MKTNRRQWVLPVLCGAILIPLGLAMAGCRAQPAEWPELGRQNSRDQARNNRPASTSPLRIEAVTNSEVAMLNSDDVVRVAKRIGFTDQEVLDFGIDLRNALYLSGGARVLVRGNVEALLQVQGGDIWIQSVTYGSHVYDLSSGTFRFEGSR